MSGLISKRELYHKLGEAYQKGYLSWGANEIIKDIIGECDSVESKGTRTMTTVEILKEMAFTATETQRRALEDAISAISDYKKMQEISLDLAFENDELINKSRWIPVSERLPEDGRPVLIYAWNVHHVVARYDSFRTENGYKKCWVTADAWNGNTEIKHDVIAWQPLPAPYEKGGE